MVLTYKFEKQVAYIFHKSPCLILCVFHFNISANSPLVSILYGASHRDKYQRCHSLCGKTFQRKLLPSLLFLRDLNVNFSTWCVEYLTWVSSSCLVVDAFFISSLAECFFNISVSLEVSLYGALAFKVSLHFRLSIRWSNWL